LIDRLVGAVVSNFELAVWAMFCVGLVVEAAVGDGPVDLIGSPAADMSL
jgi:hypothetical protein